MSSKNSDKNILQIVFEEHLNKFEKLLQLGAKEKNCAMYLYKNDARTSLFMLEGLCRIYRNLQNKKRWEKMLEKFKFVEDEIGAIDYYLAFATQFEKDKKNTEVVNNCNVKVSKICDNLNMHLYKHWLGSKSYFHKINEKVNTAEWPRQEDFNTVLQNVYKKEISKCYEFIKNCSFTDVETDLHEVRRKLRWLSIYPHALIGKIQLQKTKTVKAVYKPYLTQDVLKSKFNVFAKNKLYKDVFLLNANSFYTLSFMIAHLGKFKDQGLNLRIYSEALMGLENISAKDAEQKAIGKLKMKTDFTKNLLAQAKKACNDFVLTGALNDMVVL